MRSCWSHAGHERAANTPKHDAPLANPLLLREPLRRGVKVVVAHAAALGEGVDLDHAERPARPSFQLFLRLMDEQEFVGRLFGELSATVHRSHGPELVRTLLARTDLHSRLVNGSDYPLPAIGRIHDLERFERWGVLEIGDAEALEEIREHNPLLFDFVLKRTLRHIDPATKKEHRFPPEVFYAREQLSAASTMSCARSAP